MALLGWVLCVLAVCAGLGWLYLLRDTSVLAAGPAMTGALPLQELAGNAAQPLLRVIAAWVPAGFAAGLALGLCTRMRPAAIAAGSGIAAFVILYPSTAASESVEHNERLSRHLGPALHHTGLWAAVALMVIGSLLAAHVARRSRRREPVPTTSPRAWSSAA